MTSFNEDALSQAAIKIVACDQRLTRSNRGSSGIVGKLASIKMQRVVCWWTQAERDCVYLLEIDDDILSYQVRPFKILYTFRDKPHTFIPNFLLHRPNGEQLIKITLGKQREDGDIEERKINFLRERCLSIGYELCVLTEPEIREQPRLDNAKALLKYATTPVDAPIFQLFCLELFTQQPIVPLGQLIQYFEMKGASKRHVYALMFRKVLQIDLTAQITAQTPVRFTGPTIFQ